MTNGTIVGKGRMAEVYRTEDGRALKLFYDWVPEKFIEYEASAATAAADAGVPSPRCYGTVTQGDRHGILYEYVSGVSMLVLLSKKPLQIKGYGRQLARLHYAVHQCKSDKLIEVGEKFARVIGASREKLGERTDELIAALPAPGAPGRLCHGDFHPDNIMVGAQAVVIDWTNSYLGDPLSDVARTMLMLSSPYMPESVPAAVKFLSRFVKKSLLKAYLKEYIKLSGAAEDDINRWLPAVAASRLIENVPGEEKWLMSMVK